MGTDEVVIKVEFINFYRFYIAVTAPTDGILFRLNASGIMQGVINNGGSETTVVLTGFSPDPATMYHFLISIHNDRTEFWIDDVLYGATKQLL